MEITFGAHEAVTAVCFVLALGFGFSVSKCVHRACILAANTEQNGGFIIGAILTGFCTIFFMVHAGIGVNAIIMNAFSALLAT